MNNNMFFYFQKRIQEFGSQINLVLFDFVKVHLVSFQIVSLEVMVYFKFREYDQQVKSPAVYKLRRPTFHPLISVISGGGSKRTISY